MLAPLSASPAVLLARLCCGHCGTRAPLPTLLGIPAADPLAPHSPPQTPHPPAVRQDPTSLAALSLTTIQLAAAGNALMVPRALYLRDAVWLTGSAWGCLVFGWAQMLSLTLGVSSSGQRFLSPPLFAAFTLALWGWLAWVLRRDARAKALPSALDSLRDLTRRKRQ